MYAETPLLEITDAVFEIGGQSLQVCMQCGTCTGVCPWGLVQSYSPRWIIRMASLGLEGYEKEELWNCVTCGTCVDRCPRGIDLVDVVRSIRSVMQEGGMVPPELRAPLGGLRVEGNPWEGKRADRGAWAEDLGVPLYSPELEHLLFTCCTHVYDNRFKRVLRGLAKLLQEGGVSFGILGSEESCCGDQAHKCGAHDTFIRLERANANAFSTHGVSQIIATSPHCMNAFDKHYAGRYRTEHYTQTLERLIREEKLTPTREVPLRVAYHDPCYLGRHNGVYEPPRQVLQSIPGLEYIELPRNRAKSLCCGGGGGGLWREVPVDHRFSVLRIKEAQAAGAQVIATACPYCTIMLEDGLRALGIEEEELRVMEVAELVRQSVE